MTSSLKRLGMFSIFLPAAMALFWPYILIIVAVIAAVLTYSLDSSVISVLTAQSIPQNPVSAIFLLPVYLLFTIPYTYCANGGLDDIHYDILNQLLSSGIYTSLGLALAIIIAANIVGWSAYALKHTFENTWKEVIAGTLLVFATFIAIMFSF